MSSNMIHKIAENIGEDEHTVSTVIDEFLLQLHRGLYESTPGEDYIVGILLWEIGKQGFYHLLGFLDFFSERYDWEEGIASEYLLRLGGRSTWYPYRHQMEGWKDPKEVERGNKDKNGIQ